MTPNAPGYARRIFRLQLIGLGLALLIGTLIGADALHHRTSAAVLLTVGGMLVLDGATLPLNARMLAPDQAWRPAWVVWVSALTVFFGAAVIVSAAVFLWHPLAN